MTIKTKMKNTVQFKNVLKQEPGKVYDMHNIVQAKLH